MNQSSQQSFNTGMAKEKGFRLRELSTSASKNQDTGARSLGQAFLTTYVQSPDPDRDPTLRHASVSVLEDLSDPAEA